MPHGQAAPVRETLLALRVAHLERVLRAQVLEARVDHRQLVEIAVAGGARELASASSAAAAAGSPSACFTRAARVSIIGSEPPAARRRLTSASASRARRARSRALARP